MSSTTFLRKYQYFFYVWFLPLHCYFWFKMLYSLYLPTTSVLVFLTNGPGVKCFSLQITVYCFTWRNQYSTKEFVSLASPFFQKTSLYNGKRQRYIYMMFNMSGQWYSLSLSNEWLSWSPKALSLNLVKCLSKGDLLLMVPCKNIIMRFLIGIHTKNAFGRFFCFLRKILYQYL